MNGKRALSDAARETIRERLRDWHSMYWDTCMELHKTDKKSWLHRMTLDNILMILRFLWARENYKSELKIMKEAKNQFPFRVQGPQGKWLNMFMTVEDFPEWVRLEKACLFARSKEKQCWQFIEGRLSMLLMQFQKVSLMFKNHWSEKVKKSLHKATPQHRLEIYECCNAEAEFYITHLNDIFGKRNFDRFVLVQKIETQEAKLFAAQPMPILRIMIMGAGVPRELIEESLVLRSLRVHELDKLHIVNV